MWLHDSQTELGTDLKRFSSKISFATSSANDVGVNTLIILLFEHVWNLDAILLLLDQIRQYNADRTSVCYTKNTRTPQMSWISPGGGKSEECKRTGSEGGERSWTIVEKKRRTVRRDEKWDRQIQIVSREPTLLLSRVPPFQKAPLHQRQAQQHICSSQPHLHHLNFQALQVSLGMNW